MDGPRSRGYGARSGYDVRTRCIRGCTERRQGVSPGPIRHETETARFRLGRASADDFGGIRFWTPWRGCWVSWPCLGLPKVSRALTLLDLRGPSTPVSDGNFPYL